MKSEGKKNSFFCQAPWLIDVMLVKEPPFCCNRVPHWFVVLFISSEWLNISAICSPFILLKKKTWDCGSQCKSLSLLLAFVEEWVVRPLSCPGPWNGKAGQSAINNGWAETAPGA